jgi:hypothetical protein
VWITSQPCDDGDVVRRVATNCCYQTYNARFCLFCCKLVMRCDVMRWDNVPVKKNTCVSGYHLPVSIQHRLVNEIRKPFDYPDITVKKVSNRGYVRRGGGLLLLRVVSPFRNPHHPKVSSPFSYYNDNPKMADLFLVKVYLWGRFLIIMITHRWRTKK